MVFKITTVPEYFRNKNHNPFLKILEPFIIIATMTVYLIEQMKVGDIFVKRFWLIYSDYVNILEAVMTGDLGVLYYYIC